MLVCLQAGAAAAIASGRDVLGSVLYCLSLNHKQMALYFAPAFFAHLMGTCLQKPTVGQKVHDLFSLLIAFVCYCTVVLWGKGRHGRFCLLASLCVCLCNSSARRSQLWGKGTLVLAAGYVDVCLCNPNRTNAV